jgi:hypothetical protein
MNTISSVPAVMLVEVARIPFVPLMIIHPEE